MPQSCGGFTFPPAPLCGEGQRCDPEPGTCNLPDAGGTCAVVPEFCAEMMVGMINAVTLNWLHDDQYDTFNKYQLLLAYAKDSMLK